MGEDSSRAGRYDDSRGAAAAAASSVTGPAVVGVPNSSSNGSHGDAALIETDLKTPIKYVCVRACMRFGTLSSHFTFQASRVTVLSGITLSRFSTQVRYPASGGEEHGRPGAGQRRPETVPEAAGGSESLPHGAAEGTGELKGVHRPRSAARLE
jgi:hypothetical protein